MGPSVDPVLFGITDMRLDWEELPTWLRRSIERRIGARVERAETQPRGFSPALASRLSLRTGRRIFVKAIAPDAQSGAPGGQDFYRREAEVAARLPEEAPAPRLLDSWEEGGWVVLAFEDVEGRHPALPWDRVELDSVLDAMAMLAHQCTPSPVNVPAARVPGGLNGWARLADHPDRLDRLPGLDPWVRTNLDRLAAIGATSVTAFDGSSLLHTDIRADNILLTDSCVVFVDWPHARVGAPWVDLVFFLPSVAMQGGPDPDSVFWSHPSARRAEPDAVIAVLSGVAGFFVHWATEDPPPGLPTLRQFQLAQGIEALGWLRHLMG
jgi:hypothetical protein